VTYWSFWVSGLALTAVMVSHLVLTRRQMAVSGRFTSLVNRLRFGAPKPLDLDQDELIRAIREATLSEFGEVDPPPASAPEPAPGAQPVAFPEPPRSLGEHLAFLAALFLGGVVSKLLSGDGYVAFALSSRRLAALTAHEPLVLALVLVLGGICVGFGTRMAGGCTSGHGLCGASRFQPGSLLATAAFFGAGIATAFTLSLL
jgi:hypothetical protein